MSQYEINAVVTDVKGKKIVSCADTMGQAHDLPVVQERLVCCIILPNAQYWLVLCIAVEATIRDPDWSIFRPPKQVQKEIVAEAVAA